MDKEKKISSENINLSQPANAKQTTGKNSKIFKPIAIVDAKISDFVDWFQTISLVKLGVTLSEGAILFGVVSYIVTIPNRQRQEIQQAREVLDEQSNNQYSDGRIEALKVLNKHCQGNPGLEAPKGKMANLRLYRYRCLSFQNGSLKVKKHSMNLSNSNLKGVDLSGAKLQGINLIGSDLRNANLAGANLEGADLSGAKLQGANLSRAKLKGAILKNSELNGSNLYGANFEGADLSNAQLTKIKALWAKFNHAKFNHANLESANFNRAQLMGADFYKANLQNSLLRFATLSSNTNLQGKQLTAANLREVQSKAANLREADLNEANLWGTKFWSVSQLNRAKNVQKDKKLQKHKLMPNWELQIRQPRHPRLRIALLKPKAQQSIFEAYELGMRRAANRRVEIWAIPYGEGVENEAKAIEELIEKGIDGIILTPEDPSKSIDALKTASKAGVAITTVDFCFDDLKAKDLAIACYDTNKFQMGYDSGEHLAEWAKKHILANSPSQKKIVEVALVDGANHERYYPYLQGVLKRINESDHLKIKDSVGVASPKDIKKVTEMLKDKDNGQVQILWGGSNLATEVAIKAVKKSGRDKVKVFGILDLSMEKANNLFDDKNPLQLIIDQSGHLVGYKAVKRTIDVLRGKCSGADYNHITIKHRPLTEDSLNKREVQKLISLPQTLKNEGKNC